MMMGSKYFLSRPIKKFSRKLNKVSLTGKRRKYMHLTMGLSSTMHFRLFFFWGVGWGLSVVYTLPLVNEEDCQYLDCTLLPLVCKLPQVYDENFFFSFTFFFFFFFCLDVIFFSKHDFFFIINLGDRFFLLFITFFNFN